MADNETLIELTKKGIAAAKHGLRCAERRLKRLERPAKKSQVVNMSCDCSEEEAVLAAAIAAEADAALSYDAAVGVTDAAVDARNECYLNC